MKVQCKEGYEMFGLILDPLRHKQHTEDTQSLGMFTVNKNKMKMMLLESPEYHNWYST